MPIKCTIVLQIKSHDTSALLSFSPPGIEMTAFIHNYQCLHFRRCYLNSGFHSQQCYLHPGWTRQCKDLHQGGKATSNDSKSFGLQVGLKPQHSSTKNSSINPYQLLMSTLMLAAQSHVCSQLSSNHIHIEAMNCSLISCSPAVPTVYVRFF